MPSLTVKAQDEALRAKCPQFRLVGDVGWMGAWEGTLRPICQTYRIRVVYFPRRILDGWRLTNHYVNVFVVDPPVGPDPRGTGEPPQHVYRLGHPQAFPALCINDPIDDAWWPNEFIVDRIIPWTIKWLFFHELWLTTGVWKGGGRHPEVSETWLRGEDLDRESRARRVQFRNAEFHRLGRKIGVFASFPSMAAASVGSFQPLFWRDWSGAMPVDAQLHHTSTSWQAPRQAESSPWDWVQDFWPSSSYNSTSEEDAKSFLPLPTLRSAA
jgi:hypothetical protein